MDTVLSLQVIGIVGAATQIIKMLGKQYNFPVSGIITIIVALVVGFAAGFLGIDGTDPVSGIIAAMSTITGFSAADRINKE